MMLYDSNNVNWVSGYGLSSPLGTRCGCVRTKETSTMHRTVCGAPQHIFIPWVLFGSVHDSWSKSSTSNMSWCTIHHNTLPSALASPLLVLPLKCEEYSSLPGQYPCWSTQLMVCGALSPCSKILSNWLPFPSNFSPHLAFWSTTVSGLLWCCTVTMTPFAAWIFRRRIYNAHKP